MKWRAGAASRVAQHGNGICRRRLRVGRSGPLVSGCMCAAPGAWPPPAAACSRRRGRAARAGAAFAPASLTNEHFFRAQPAGGATVARMSRSMTNVSSWASITETAGVSSGDRQSVHGGWAAESDRRRIYARQPHNPRTERERRML